MLEFRRVDCGEFNLTSLFVRFTNSQNSYTCVCILEHLIDGDS